MQRGAQARSYNKPLAMYAMPSAPLEKNSTTYTYIYIRRYSGKLKIQNMLQERREFLVIYFCVYAYMFVCVRVFSSARCARGASTL